MAVLDLPDAPGQARDSLVLKHVVADEAEVTWVPLRVGDRLELLVMADALKLGGVRIGAGAGLAQQVADALGALLLTPKVLDIMYAARAVTVEPMTQFDQNQMLTTHWFVKESTRIDAAIAAAGGLEPGGIAQTVGKPWMLTNGLLSNTGKACNYGWHCPPGSVQVAAGAQSGSWKQTPAYRSVTLPGVYVLQQPGYAHGLDEADYSEMIVLMHRDCMLDGKPADLRDVLTDAALAPMISHEGAIRVPGLRQPGVAQFACKTKARAVMPAASGTTSGMCPTPPWPVVTRGGWWSTHWPWTIAGAAGVAAGAAGVAWRRGWWPFRAA